MIKRIDCKEISKENCTFSATGKNIEETKKIIFQHLASDHPDFLLNLEGNNKRLLEDELEDIFERVKINQNS